MDDIAEITQTIYFIQNNQLCFLRLSDQDSWAQVIRKDSIFDFNVSGEKAISAITSTNELGDAVTASTGSSDTNVYIKDNMLWDLQEDIADLVDAALQKVKGFTMNQFSLKWRGKLNCKIKACRNYCYFYFIFWLFCYSSINRCK